MRVLIVADNMSTRMGGEAVLPTHYLRELRSLGVDAHALTHTRVAKELTASLYIDAAHCNFVDDTLFERATDKASKWFPGAIRETLFMNAISVSTGLRLARRARELAADIRADIIHQPTPVSPAAPSFLTRMPAPVVIGPMNGGMSYPPAFEREYSSGSGVIVRASRSAAALANSIFPGKREAAALLVANGRTRDGLPKPIDRSRARILVENGVDLEAWGALQRHAAPATPTFIFVGRLVWLKAVDLLIAAFEKVEGDAVLRIIGDGDERAALERLAAASSAAPRIRFEGFRPQAEIRDALASATALVLPSLRDCGGAVILEAFASGVPAIATDWGGPKDYVTPQSGILVAPSGKDAFVAGLADAMNQLARDPARAIAMGAEGRRLVEEKYSWREKARAMVAIYEEVLGARR
jgi:glycosyltransferase involved in cell wall biosynthesis